MEGLLESDESFSQAQATRDHEEFKYLKQLASSLQSLREQDILCDITVIVDDESFRAHKAVLVAVSDVFRAMFTSGLKESNSEEITLQDDVDLSAEGFTLLLDFAYTGQMQLNPESVFEVLATACHLHVVPALDACIAYIDQCFHNELLNFEDYLKISSMAGNYGLQRLKDIADAHIARNFAEVSQTEDFMEHMTAKNLLEFLQRNDLSVCTEQQVLSGVCKWLQYDKEKRIHHTMPLLRKIRLGLISAQDLVSYIDSDLQGIPQCKGLFDQFMQHHALRSGKASGTGPLMTTYPGMFSPRVSTKAILAIGGQTSLACMRYYSQDQQRWIPLKKFAQLPFARVSHHGALVVSGQLFVAGGEYTDNSDVRTHNFFFQYDASANRWLRLPTMKVARSKFAMLHMDGFIYVIGGQNQSGQWMCATERFNMAQGKWQIVSSLDVPIKQPLAVAHNSKLLVLGLDFNNTLHVLVFHPNENQWTSHCSLYYPQCRAVIPMVYEDACYQVTFRSKCSQLDPTTEWSYSPEVLQLTCDFDADTKAVDTIVSISENIDEQEVDQRFISESELPTFRIRDKVFVVANGHIQRTGLVVETDQVYDVDLEAWDPLGQSIEGAAITNFIFDRHTLE